MVRRIVACMALLLCVSLVASCGSSDKGGKDATKKTTTSTTEKGGAGDITSTTAAPNMPSSFSGGDKAAFCQAWSDMFKQADIVINTNDANDVRTKYTKIGDIAKRLLAAASDQIKSDIQTAIRFNDQVIAAGNLKPFDDPASKKAGSRISAYANAQCPGATTTR